MRFCNSLILLRGNQAIKAAYDRFNADIEDESGERDPFWSPHQRLTIFAVPGNDQMEVFGWMWPVPLPWPSSSRPTCFRCNLYLCRFSMITDPDGPLLRGI